MQTVNTINMLRESICEMEALLQKLEDTDYSSDGELFEKVINELEFLSEKYTCNVRQFLQNTYVGNRDEVMSKACNITGIDVCKKDNMVYINLPCLLPRKKGKEHKFIGEPLRFKLEELSKTVDLKIREKAVICIIHTYDNVNKKARCYDYDNLETKKILDIITLFTLVDDAPEYCDVYHTVKLSDKDKTSIIVVPLSSFNEKFVPYNL